MRFDVDAIQSLLVGSHFGIVEDLARVPTEQDDIPLSVYAAEIANLSACGDDLFSRAASGANLSDRAARAACLGEAVERYAASLVEPGSVVQARFHELGRMICPTEFALFSPQQYQLPLSQFPFRVWNENDRLGWVRCESLHDDQEVWVPASFVYQPFRSEPGEPTLAPSISTGLACGPTRETALLAGLCEVIERDAVALAWLGQYRPAKVALSQFPVDTQLSQLIEQYSRCGLRSTVFDLTTEFRVPVYAALVEGHSSVGSVVSFGSACHPDPHRACFKALLEAAHARVYVKSLVRRDPSWRAGRDFCNVRSFADHARVYTSHPELRHAFDHWWKTARVVELAASSDPAERSPQRIIAQLDAAGFRVLARWLTTPDIQQLGWHVVRVLIPGLQPLHGHHRWPHLGGRRLRRLSEVFGVGAASGQGINRFPHPCP